jgi:hypothetical protein
MSKLRPTLCNADPGTTVMRNGTAYLMIFNAVQSRAGLVHGELQKRGEFCAIGSYFEINRNTGLPSELIDEVAAVNDSMPTVSRPERRRRVLRWLRWKLTAIGMPGFKPRKAA